MTEKANLRKRTPPASQDHTNNTPVKRVSPSVCTAVESHPRLRTLRFCIVWTARLLLPIVYILSTAKLVTIPDPTVGETNKPTTVGQTSAILIFTHARAAYLERCLESLLRSHPCDSSWPIIVSKDEQDGPHPSIGNTIAKFRRQARSCNITIIEWTHFGAPENSSDKTVGATSDSEQVQDNDDNNNNNDIKQLLDGVIFVNVKAYRRISKHYRWALARALGDEAEEPSRAGWKFNGERLQRVVIVEDDMLVARDFYNYFTALSPLLDADESLYCVSAWNDNGVSALSLNSSQLHRTDFFPGLGWMLTRSLWGELRPKWPHIFWDDWMRSRAQTKGRQCIRPEVSRTSNFGREGVSQSFHFQNHVSKVVLSTQFVNFTALDLSYLHTDSYFHMFFSRFSNATRLKFSNYLTSRHVDGDVIAFYPHDRLEAIGRRTGIMTDHRDGIRRTSYHGVIVFPWRGYWAFVVERGWNPPEGYQLGSSECC